MLLGTLVIVVLEAKDLPNKVRVGKQNTYATLKYGLHKKRTKTVERGGQVPEWDEDFRFDIHDDDVNSVLHLACYADDPKDPTLIGETSIDLEPIIRKGMKYDWFPLEKQSHPAGEVKIEFTFYTNVSSLSATGHPTTTNNSARSPPHGQ